MDELVSIRVVYETSEVCCRNNVRAHPVREAAHVLHRVAEMVLSAEACAHSHGDGPSKEAVAEHQQMDGLLHAATCKAARANRRDRIDDARDASPKSSRVVQQRRNNRTAAQHLLQLSQAHEH